MGEVKDKLTVIGRAGIKEVDSIFDSGATFCQIDETLAKEVGIIMLGQKMTQELGDKRKVEAEIGFGVVQIKKCTIPTLFAVSPQGTYKMIIGQNLMQPYGVKLDLQKETYEVACPMPRA